MKAAEMPLVAARSAECVNGRRASRSKPRLNRRRAHEELQQQRRWCRNAALRVNFEDATCPKQTSLYASTGVTKKQFEEV